MRKMAMRIVGFGLFLSGLCGVTALVVMISTGVIDLRQTFPNLPPPPAIEGGVIPLPEPNILGIEIPEAVLGDRVQLEETGLVVRRSLTQSIPAPQQVSTAPDVIGSNILLAILMAMVFGVCSTMIDGMLRDEEPRIRAWLNALGLSKIPGTLRKVFQWTLGRSVKRGCLTLPLIIMILALYGIIFAFLERGTSLFSREGAFLAVGMAFTVGLISFSGDIARRIMGRIWRTDSAFHLYPINLGVAVFTVIASHLFGLTPGLAFGTPGGADMDMPDAVRERRERALALVTIGLIAFFVLAGWSLSAGVVHLLGQPIDTRIAETVAPLASGVQNVSLILFMIGLETLFFTMLPVPTAEGNAVFKWNKWIWAAMFVPVAFLFSHTLLNPQSGFLDSFLVSNVRFLWATLLIVSGITGGMWFYFNVIDDPLRKWVNIRLP